MQSQVSAKYSHYFIYWHFSKTMKDQGQGFNSVVQHMASMCETLGLIPNTINNIK